MIRAHSLALAVFVFAFGCALDARAERVVLIRPEPSDPVLFDAWNRLAAELRIHRFEVEPIEATPGEMPGSALAASAEKQRATAAMALIRHGREASVDLWLVDRASGKTTLRTIVVESGRDAASVLAIRAVDLLRASLREFPQGEPPPKDVAGVDRDRPPTSVVTAFTAPAEPRGRLRAEAWLFVQGQAGVAAGPALALSYRLADRFEVGVAGAGPIVGARVDSPNGSATLQQGIAWADARFDAVRELPFMFGVNAALGCYFLRAEGDPEPPLRSRTDGLTAAVGALGLHAEARIAKTVAVGVAVRGVAAFPRVGVSVGDASTLLGRPSLILSAGIRVSL